MNKEKEITTPDIGVASYKIKCNGSLHGKWTVANAQNDPAGSSDGNLGIEIATPLSKKKKSLAGLYKVEIYLKGNEIFSGKLEIDNLNEDVYQMFWKQGDTIMYKGYGIKRKRILSANYWKLDLKKA